MDKRERKERFFRFLTAAVLPAAAFLLLAAAAQKILMPKYMGAVTEGNFTEEYYRDPTSHDLLIIGNCESYENISPIELWREFGITSFIRGNANQLVSQSYCLLMDALERETPKAVLFNVQAMEVAGQDTEEYNRMVFDGMPWSRNKWEGIMASKMEDESMAEYLFPILRYHSRWSTLERDDFIYSWEEKPLTSFQGYYLRADVRPAGAFPRARRRADYSFPEENFYYLDRIREACQERGIDLILMKAPSLYPEWPEPYEEQIEAYAREHGLLYYNFLELTEECGLDMAEDTYDEGLHLNVYGAEKVARYLGEALQKEIGLPDRRGEAKTASYYEERRKAYEEEKARQAEEFEKFGYISRFAEE